ncbi:MAG: primase-helicase family protein [Luteolibacter sp.]
MNSPHDWKMPPGALSNELTDAPAEPLERFYYDGSRYYLDTGSEYVGIDQRSVTRHMKGWGFQPQDIESTLCRIQAERHIHFAGPLAGHPRGLHTAGRVKLLATVPPKIIATAPGDWPILRAVIEGLLVDPQAESLQVETFLAWLKIARESLVSNRRRPGQALALAGPRGCGKSLLIDITEAALGERRANPYAYFTGRTNFNADLAGAELLAVDDEAGSTDIRSRKNFAANIKANLFSGKVRIEGKNKTAFVFLPCWRMMIALNDEPEALLVLPPITEDIADKIILFRCHKRPLPMSAHTLKEREDFFAQLMAELPAMLAWLEAWEIPDALREERCGVKAFHHPAILSGLHELSPEGQLVRLLDAAAAKGEIELPWTGTAHELTALLTSRDAAKLLNWHAATGTYLARLEGDRVERLPMRNGIQCWLVLPSGPVDHVLPLNIEEFEI